jgi:hypothetical protein
MLSEDGQKILYEKLKNFYKKLKPEGRAYFDDSINAPCPMKDLTKTKEIYFWKFIDQYLCFMSGPRAISLKAGKSAELLGGMSLQGSVARQNQGGKGAYPQLEIGKILDHVGFAKDYYIKYATDPPKFHVARKPQFVVVMQSKFYTKNYMEEIPADLIADPKYELMCASLVIANTKANRSEMHRWHAVAGFVCNGKGYIYDSNQRKVFKCDWWKRADFIKVVNEEVAQHYSFFRGGRVNVHAYAFAIFARKEFTKDIGAACLMKYRVKTPVTALNFTNPNTGRIINSNRYNYLKPAERAALKRKWAATKHREVIYLNKSTFNSILARAENFAAGNTALRNLTNAGYKIKDPKNYNEFLQKLRKKFTTAVPVKTYTFTNAKAHLNQFTKSTAAVRKRQYSLLWQGIPMPQRKVLMHWRNKGVWLANNAFEKSVAKPKPKTPSPSPNTKRATQVRTNFEKYWKAIQPENRKMIRNYVAAYKSPSPQRISALNAAKRNVNALKTAKARKEYRRKMSTNLNQNNWMDLSRYIEKKNLEAQMARSAKKAAKA